MGTVDPKTKRRRRTPPRQGRSAGGPAPLREHKDWPEFCSLIIKALTTFPEAKEAVKEALRRKLQSEE